MRLKQCHKPAVWEWLYHYCGFNHIVYMWIILRNVKEYLYQSLRRVLFFSLVLLKVARSKLTSSNLGATQNGRSMSLTSMTSMISGAFGGSHELQVLVASMERQNSPADHTSAPCSHGGPEGPRSLEMEMVWSIDVPCWIAVEYVDGMLNMLNMLNLLNRCWSCWWTLDEDFGMSESWGCNYPKRMDGGFWQHGGSSAGSVEDLAASRLALKANSRPVEVYGPWALRTRQVQSGCGGEVIICAISTWRPA